MNPKKLKKLLKESNERILELKRKQKKIVEEFELNDQTKLGVKK
jgi:hypothetical protein